MKAVLIVMGWTFAAGIAAALFAEFNKIRAPKPERRGDRETNLERCLRLYRTGGAS